MNVSSASVFGVAWTHRPTREDEHLLRTYEILKASFLAIATD